MEYTLPSMDGGGELHELRATDSTSKSALCGFFLFVCQIKINIIFVLNFRISYLIFFSSFLSQSRDRAYPTGGF